MFDLKDLVSSLKLLMYEAENLLELVFSRLIFLALRPHSLKLKSVSSLLREVELCGEEDCSIISEEAHAKPNI